MMGWSNVKCIMQLVKVKKARRLTLAVCIYLTLKMIIISAWDDRSQRLTSFISFVDGPVFRTRPKSIEADNGAKIALVCDVVGNPPPDILWIHEPHDKVTKPVLR